jgi:predicted regulator of Ras-like GTPase activity (Roadblock/LC7/MglB family)
MLAFLKTIFRGRAAAPESAGGLAIPRTVYTAGAGSARSSRGAQPGRAIAKPAPAPTPEPVAPDSNSALGSDVDISLQSVLRGLPNDLKDRVRDLDIRGATMTISLERILAQLPSGSVKISFGSLRHAAPELFSAGADCDSRDVALPLDEILAKMNPAMICRPQEAVRHPVEARTNHSSDTERMTRTEPSVQPTPSRSSGFFIPSPSAPSEPVNAPLDEIPDLFFDGIKTEDSNSNHENSQIAAGSPATPTRKATPVKAETTPSATARKPNEVTVPVPESAPPSKETPVMRIPLKDLTPSWPEELRAEIGHWNLPQPVVSLPAKQIDAALKQGKVAFPWETLRSCIVPAPPAGPSAHDKTMLELPLPVIMPLFLAGRTQAEKAQPQIDDDIPDPFAEFLQPLPVEARRSAKPGKTKPKRSGPKSNGKPGVAPAVVEKLPKPDSLTQQTAAPSNAQVEVQPEADKGPDFASPSPTPVEVLAAAVRLNGVAGALVALPDGFKVASKLPPGLDGDALAAFLPHIFSKVNQSTRELRMGELSNLNFTVDNIPWKIFRVNQIFFAALGHAGQPMPTEQLAALAQKLTFKN